MAAQDIATRPNVFSQGHNDRAQKVDIGRLVQVQLPSNSGAIGDPVVDWNFRAEVSGAVTLLDTAQVKSPGRIDGLDTLVVFQSLLSPAPGARIVIASAQSNLIGPTGVYAILLQPLD